MKYSKLISLFCIFCTQSIYSFERDKCEELVARQIDSDRKCICYEFRLSKMNYVLIADGDTICDVFIYNNDGRSLSTTCEKTPVLKWAFEDMADGSGVQNLTEDSVYTAAYIRLSLLHRGSRQIIDTSRVLRNGCHDEVRKKLDELKSYIVQLWSTNFIGDADKENGNTAIKETDAIRKRRQQQTIEAQKYTQEKLLPK